MEARSILRIGNALQPHPRGGREMLSRLHVDAMRELFSDRFAEFELHKPAQVKSIAGAIVRGHVDGLSPVVLEQLVGELHDKRIVEAWIDGSNLGAAAAMIRRRCAGVRITTFFHNCETRFFLDALRRGPAPRALGVLAANARAERLAVRNSDRVVCLNERDSRQLSLLHGRGADAILPMALRDECGGPGGSGGEGGEGGHALFVGGDFYANVRGMNWFTRHVAPHSALPVVVVGKGMERHRQRLEANGNVRVVGEVEDVAPWYLGAKFVLAPIFDGSGMKTKVAEALMFGKRVVGTPEAFVGYEQHAGEIGVVCRTAADFLDAMRAEDGRASPSVDSALRGIYEAHYSRDAAKAHLAAILRA